MVQRLLDTTENYPAAHQLARINANFADLYGHSGTFTANSTTAVTVTDVNVTATSQIMFTMKTAGGTPVSAPYVTTITPGTGFTVKAGSGDTSVYNYQIIG